MGRFLSKASLVRGESGHERVWLGASLVKSESGQGRVW